MRRPIRRSRCRLREEGNAGAILFLVQTEARRAITVMAHQASSSSSVVVVDESGAGDGAGACVGCGVRRRAQADTEVAEERGPGAAGRRPASPAEGRNPRALEKFDEAFRLVASPKILFDRGEAHRALGENARRCADCERFLERGSLRDQGEPRGSAARIVGALRTPTLAYVEVQTDDVGSRIHRRPRARHGAFLRVRRSSRRETTRSAWPRRAWRRTCERSRRSRARSSASP